MFLLRITKEVNIVENIFFFLIPKDIRTIERLVQDGGVEGHVLTPSCKNTRFTTNC